jgi:hypothetical protein
VLNVLERRVAGASCSADRSPEQRVSGEHALLVDQERQLAQRVPGDVNGADVQIADPDLVTVLELNVEIPEQGAFLGVSADRAAEARLVVGVVRYVVDVVVRAQHVAERQAQLVDLGQDWPRRAARVDQHGVASGLVGHQVRIG